MSMLCMIDINLTRDASAHLRIAEEMLLRDQDGLCLEEASEHHWYLIGPSHIKNALPQQSWLCFHRHQRHGY